MLVSGFVSILLNKYQEVLFGTDKLLPAWSKFPLIVLITTIAWIVVTYLTKPEKQEILEKFYIKIQPASYGWRPVIQKAVQKGKIIVDPSVDQSLTYGILAMLIGTILVYAILFGIGNLIYANILMGLLLFFVALICSIVLVKMWPKIKGSIK
jgi:hypothetical protein